MADAIKYQPTGRVFSDIPSLSFANVRESFKRSESMSQSLDKLSQFAGKFAAEKVEEEAEQWAVNNAYTYDQILQAQQKGISADDLIASSGGGAIWQKTVRKIQGEQLRIELEGLGRQELAGIQAAVETRQLTDPNEIAMKIDAVSKGLFAPLQGLSPEAYVKGKNAFGLHASSVYNDARKKIVSDIKIAESIKADQNYQAIVELDKATINNLADGPALLAAKNLGAERVYEAYAASGDTKLAYQKSQEYRAQYDKTIVNSFVKFTSTGNNAEDFKIISSIASGEFGSPEMNAKFASLDVELQDKIRETALKRRADNFHAKEQQDKYDHFVRREEIANNKEKLLGGDLPYNQAVELATDMHRRGDISDDLYAKIKNPKADDEGNAELLGKLQLDVLDGRIKVKNDISDAVWSQLNPQQRKTLYNTIGNRNFQLSMRDKNTYVGDAVKGTDDGKYTVGADLDSRQTRIMNEADAAGKPISASDAMKRAITERDADQLVLTGLAEQENAIERIKRIPDVAKNLDKLDIDNVESFINRYGLNDSDAKTLRGQAAKFKDIQTKNTRKNWQYFMNKQQAQ
jgi:hypothetical protein